MHVEFDLEWCSDGIKLAEKAKGVHSCYTDENRIHKITLIGEKSMAVIIIYKNRLLMIWVLSVYLIIHVLQDQDTLVSILII